MQAQEALRAYQFDWDDEMVRLARARVCVWVRVNRIDAIVHFQRGLSQSNETNQIELTQVDYNLIRELLAYIVNSGYEQVHAKHTHTHTTRGGIVAQGQGRTTVPALIVYVVHTHSPSGHVHPPLKKSNSSPSTYIPHASP